MVQGDVQVELQYPSRRSTVASPLIVNPRVVEQESAKVAALEVPPGSESLRICVITARRVTEALRRYSDPSSAWQSRQEAATAALASVVSPKQLYSDSLRRFAAARLRAPRLNRLHALTRPVEFRHDVAHRRRPDEGAGRVIPRGEKRLDRGD